jgi:hypothetical protein
MKNKKESLYIDCIAMKHHIQNQIWDELKPLSTEDYFKKLQKRIDNSKFAQQIIKRSRKRRKSADIFH